MDAKVELLALDVDGTLIPHGGSLSTENYLALKAAQATGVRVTFVTGRSWPGLSPLPAGLGFPGPHVCVGGAHIAGERNSFTPLPAEVTDVALHVAAESRIPFGLYLDNGMIQVDPRAVEVLTVVGEPRAFLIEDRRGAAALKLLLCIREEHAEKEDAVRGALEGSACELVRTSPLFFEVMPQATDKGTALARIIDEVGGTASGCVAVGDAQNDLPMLLLAGIGVAMPHSPPELIEIADLVIPEERAEGGLAWVLEEIV